jgi:hypothetical protein
LFTHGHRAKHVPNAGQASESNVNGVKYSNQIFYHKWT